MDVTTPSGPRDSRMGTNLDQNAQGHAPVPHRNLDDIFDVMLANTRAIDQMTKLLVTETRIAGIRAAAAAGDKEERDRLEAIVQQQGLGGGAGPFAGTDTLAGITTAGNLELLRQRWPQGTATVTAGQTKTTSTGAGVAAYDAQGQPIPPAGAVPPTGTDPMEALLKDQPRTIAEAHLDESKKDKERFPTGMSQMRRKWASRLGSELESHGGRLAKVGTAMKESGGTWGGLLQSARQEIPGFGIALDTMQGMQDTYDWAMKQTEAGRAYERVEGPMSTAQQQMERARSELWRFQSLGESGAESAAQFKAATDLGLRGSARAFALQQMYRQTTSIGMDPQQEAEVLKIAVQNAGVSLSNLTDSLSGVSKAAQDAHVNADTARQSFIGMMQVTLGQGFGPSAGALSQAVTTSMVAMGPQMQGADASGMFSQGRMLALAGQSGMNPMQFAASNINDQGATYALASDKFTDQALQGVLGAAYPLVYQTAQQNATAIMRDSNIAGTLAQRVISNPIFYQSVPSPQAVMSVVAQLGGVQTTDIVQCVTWILQHLAGKTTAGALAAQIGQTQMMPTAKANAQRGTNPNLLTNFNPLTSPTGTSAWYGNGGEWNGVASSFSAAGRALTHGQGGITGFISNVAKAWGDQTAGDIHALGGLLGSADRALNPWYHGEKGAHTLAAIQSEEKHGQTSPVIEAVYRKIKATGMNPDDTMVEIQTKTGPIEIPFSEAVKTYPDSIASGQFVIKGHRYKDVFMGVHHGAFKYRGDDTLAGKTLAQLGITADTSATSGALAEQNKAAPKDAKSGLDVNYQGGSKGMAQMFDLTPQAAAILTPLVQGSQTAGALAASQGSPPPISTDASNPSRLLVP